MKFSIIIPIYNSEEYLCRCLDSIVNQDYNDYELILIDDGSTDNSLNICREYNKKHPQIKVITQENSGPSIARNKGLSVASGDYLLFVDSDDYVSDSYFSVLEKTIRESDSDIIMFGSVGSVTGVSAPDNAFICGNKSIIDFYANNCNHLDYNSGWNKCFKKSTYSNIRFTEKTVVEEDLLYNLAALDSAESIRLINVPLYYYFQRSSGSVTTKYNPNKFEGILDAHNKKISYAEKWNSKTLIDYYEKSFLLYISACVNNLMYKSCPLTYRQKTEAIKEMFEHEYTVNCANEIHDGSIRIKLMLFLIKHKMCKTCYLIHNIVFRLKNRE